MEQPLRKGAGPLIAPCWVGLNGGQFMQAKRLMTCAVFGVLLGFGIGVVHFTSLRSLRFTGAALTATSSAVLTYYLLAMLFPRAVGERVWLIMVPAGAAGGALFALVLGLSIPACVVAGALVFPFFWLLDRVGSRA